MTAVPKGLSGLVLRLGPTIVAASPSHFGGTAVTIPLDILPHFAALEDPRDPRFVTFRLADLLTVALCATLAGAKSFSDMATFARTKEPWLRSLGLTLEGGIPSHDT